MPAGYTRYDACCVQSRQHRHKHLGVEVLKMKQYWMIPVSFIPSILVFLLEPAEFSRGNMTSVAITLPAVVLLISLLYMWHRYLVRPAEDFLRTINRAIRGDNRARFSCDEYNENYHRLSLSFNQFMTMVEKQNEQLAENRHLQNQLLENEKIYRSALELTCERVFEADLTHNKLVYGQDSYNRTFPFLKTELYSDIIKSIADNVIYYQDCDNFFSTFNRRALMDIFTKADTTEVYLEYRQRDQACGYLWMSATIIHLSEDDGGSLKVIGYVKNIDARKRSELAVLEQSQKDGLTGLYHKMVAQSLVETYLSTEGSNGRHAAIMLDIDNFKSINDTLGHLQGDNSLVKVAQILQGLFRTTDIIGRIGGDEFFILVKNYGSAEKLIEKLRAICDLLGDILLDDNEDYKISGSIGVSFYPEDGETYSELYQKADIALYSAKNHGKSCYSVYNKYVTNQIRVLQAVSGEKQNVNANTP